MIFHSTLVWSDNGVCGVEKGTYDGFNVCMFVPLMIAFGIFENPCGTRKRSLYRTDHAITRLECVHSLGLWVHFMVVSKWLVKKRSPQVKIFIVAVSKTSCCFFSQSRFKLLDGRPLKA